MTIIKIISLEYMKVSDSMDDELIMQFYSTAHFYPDGRIVWMTEGTRYQSTVEEWAKLINAPEEHEDDLDVYAKKKM